MANTCTPWSSDLIIVDIAVAALWFDREGKRILKRRCKEVRCYLSYRLRFDRHQKMLVAVNESSLVLQYH